MRRAGTRLLGNGPFGAESEKQSRLACTDLPDRVQRAAPRLFVAMLPRAGTSGDEHEGTTVLENLQLVDDPPTLVHVATQRPPGYQAFISLHHDFSHVSLVVMVKDHQDGQVVTSRPRVLGEAGRCCCKQLLLNGIFASQDPPPHSQVAHRQNCGTQQPAPHKAE